MCGITGIISKTKLNHSDSDTCKRMNQYLFHRGPDSSGEFLDDNVILMMRRLSIIDIEGGNQPLFNEDKSLVLIANGEIYNYKEIKLELENLGHSFYTHSDCEVIIHSYQQYGTDFIHHLRGMFAFCLYDSKKDLVYIYRDRLGEKPLFYYEEDDKLFFSSEMKSILSSGRIPFELNSKAIYDYFHFQFICEPDTCIHSVRKLPAGHYIKIDLKSWDIQPIKYWDILEQEAIVGDPIELVRNELLDIGKYLVRSDVKIGIALSGGLDSSAIAALSKKYYSDQILGFSVGYPGRPENDERSDAKVLADQLNIPLVEIELKTEDLVEDFAKMNYYRDDPIADISGYGYYSISKKAHEMGVKVLLQGQGGDEMFWGYEWVKRAVEETENSRYRRSILNQFVNNWLVHLPKMNPKDTWNWIKSFGRVRGSYREIKRFKNPKDLCIFYNLTPDYNYTENNKSRLFSKPFLEKMKGYSPAERFPILDQYSSDLLIMKYISQTYLLENGIVQGDRLGMANSVEVRLPLVDYKLSNTLVGIRKNKKNEPDYKRFPKPYLRSAMKGILSEEIMNRPKRGFAPPVHEWHRALFNKYGHELEDGILANAGILTEEGKQECKQGIFPEGTVAPFSFKALVLENWLRQMKNIIDNS